MTKTSTAPIAETTPLWKQLADYQSPCGIHPFGGSSTEDVAVPLLSQVSSLLAFMSAAWDDTGTLNREVIDASELSRLGKGFQSGALDGIASLVALASAVLESDA